MEPALDIAQRAVSAVHPGPGRPARAVLRKYAATMQDVAEEIARRAGPGAVLFGGLDRDALAAIGIDLDAVRARIESSFGPEALTQAVRRQPRPSGLKGRPEHASAAAARSPGHLRGSAMGSDQPGEGADIMNGTAKVIAHTLVTSRPSAHTSATCEGRCSRRSPAGSDDRFFPD